MRARERKREREMKGDMAHGEFWHWEQIKCHIAQNMTFWPNLKSTKTLELLRITDSQNMISQVSFSTTTLSQVSNAYTSCDLQIAYVAYLLIIKIYDVSISEKNSSMFLIIYKVICKIFFEETPFISYDETPLDLRKYLM